MVPTVGQTEPPTVEPTSPAQSGSAVALPTIGPSTPRPSKQLPGASGLAPSVPANVDASSEHSPKAERVPPEGAMIATNYRPHGGRQGSAGPLGRSQGAPQSARETRAAGMGAEEGTHRDEDLIRSVYRKHAQRFFEEMREGFSKEVVILRKQALKAAKGGAAPQLVPQLDNGLAQSVASVDAAVGNLSMSMLSDRLSKQQQELRALSRQVQSEAGAAHKAVLTPLWKERTMKELAQGELKAVCATEVDRAINAFALRFAEQEVASTLQKLAESGQAPWEILMKSELAKFGSILSEEFAKLASKVDHTMSATSEMSQSVGYLKEKCDGDIPDVKAQLQVQHDRIASLAQQLINKEEDHTALTLRCEAVEARLGQQLAAMNAALVETRAQVGEEVQSLESSLRSLNAVATAGREIAEDARMRCDIAMTRVDDMTSQSNAACAAAERRAIAAEEQSAAAKQQAIAAEQQATIAKQQATGSVESSRARCIEAEKAATALAQAARDQNRKAIDDVMSEARKLCESTSAAAKAHRDEVHKLVAAATAEAKSGSELAAAEAREIAQRAAADARDACKRATGVATTELQATHASSLQAALAQCSEVRQFAEGVAHESRASCEAAAREATTRCSELQRSVDALRQELRETNVSNKADIAAEMRATCTKVADDARSRCDHTRKLVEMATLEFRRSHAQASENSRVQFEKATQIAEEAAAQAREVHAEAAKGFSAVAAGAKAAAEAMEAANKDDAVAERHAASIQELESRTELLGQRLESALGTRANLDALVQTTEHQWDAFIKRLDAIEYEVAQSASAVKTEDSAGNQSTEMDATLALTIERVARLESLSGRISSAEKETISARGDLKNALSSLSSLAAREAEAINARADFKAALSSLKSLAVRVNSVPQSDGLQTRAKSNMQDMSRISLLEARVRQNEARLMDMSHQLLQARAAPTAAFQALTNDSAQSQTSVAPELRGHESIGTAQSPQDGEVGHGRVGDEARRLVEDVDKPQEEAEHKLQEGHQSQFQEGHHPQFQEGDLVRVIASGISGRVLMLTATHAHLMLISGNKWFPIQELEADEQAQEVADDHALSLEAVQAVGMLVALLTDEEDEKSAAGTLVGCTPEPGDLNHPMSPCTPSVWSCGRRSVGSTVDVEHFWACEALRESPQP